MLQLLRGSDSVAPRPRVPGRRDWEQIIHDAAIHGLTPFVYRWLAGSDRGEHPPEELAQVVSRQFRRIVARNMLLASELGDLLWRFGDAGVPCVPLRGPALAEDLYGDVSARPFGDLDLLVQKHDLKRVAAVMRTLGFRLLEHRAGFAQAFSYTLVFRKERHCWVIVEPHWTIVYPPFVDSFDMRRVWERCVRGRVVGVDTWVLGRAELLLHLCLHLSHPDGGAPLLWFYELDRFLRAEADTIEWSEFLAVARRGRVEFLVSAALASVRGLFATPVPREVLRSLARARHELHDGRWARLLSGGARASGREELAALFAVKGVRTRIRYVLGLLFPSPEFMRIQYGADGVTRLAGAYVRRTCHLPWQVLKTLASLLR